MAISKSEDVFQLVKSLSKAEKRAFRLYAKRIQDDSDLLYLRLFDIMDRQKVLNEKELKEKVGDLTGSRYSNLKRHLYKQILITLRLLLKDKKANIKIREYIDFAYVLYGKGLYMPALDILEKAKKIAVKHHTDFSLLTIVEIEKMIHSRHITRSQSESVEKMLSEASKLADTVRNRVKLSNLRLVMHKFYIEQGHARNKEEQEMVTERFKEQLPSWELEDLGLMEKVYLYQSYVWYYYIINDFENCLIYSKKWVELFQSSRELQLRDVNLYLRGFHYLLTSCFNLRLVREFKLYHLELEDFRKTNYAKFDNNTQITSFLYAHGARMNLHFLQGTFDEGVKGIGKTLNRINRYRSKLDEHKILVLYYKISWMYLGNQIPHKAIEYLDQIIAMSRRSLRDDIQSYARLMYMMAIYDMEEYDMIPQKNLAFKKFFEQIKDKNEVQITIYRLFQEIARTPLFERKAVFKKYYTQLLKFESSPYEKRAFLYLEILPWLQGKIEGKELSKVIGESSIR